MSDFLEARKDKKATINDKFAGFAKIINAIENTPLYEMSIPGWRQLDGKVRAVSYVVENDASNIAVYDLYQNEELALSAFETVESQLNQLEDSEYYENVSVKDFTDTVVFIQFEGVSDFSDVRL